MRRCIVGCVLSLIAVAGIAADLPTCTTGMAPWRVEYLGGYTGLTAAEACSAAGVAFAASTGTNVDYGVMRSDGLCQLYYEGDVGNRYPSTQVCTPGTAEEPPVAGGDKLSTEFIAKILATYFGIWALGFGVGKSVAWVRALGSVG